MLRFRIARQRFYGKVWIQPLSTHEGLDRYVEYLPVNTLSGQQRLITSKVLSKEEQRGLPWVLLDMQKQHNRSARNHYINLANLVKYCSDEEGQDSLYFAIQQELTQAKQLKIREKIQPV
jgi:hypothetical protein